MAYNRPSITPASLPDTEMPFSEILDCLSKTKAKCGVGRLYEMKQMAPTAETRFELYSIGFRVPGMG